jgi:hypothetical protein
MTVSRSRVDIPLQPHSMTASIALAARVRVVLME